MLVTIYLVDILDATVSGTCRPDIITRVKALYTECFAVANARPPKEGPHTFEVKFATTKPVPTATDLIIYFMPATFYSLIQYEKTRSKHSNLLGTHWGLTEHTPAKGQTPASSKTEIAAKSADGAILGSLVVHEILHAKTGKSNAQLHPSGGLGAATVEAATALNATNKADIAGTITKPVTQWLGGWDILVDAKRARDSGDPSWDLF